MSKAINIREIKSRERWAWHVARMGERRGAYRIPVVKAKGKRPLGKPRPRWEDNIRMGVQNVGWGIDVARDRDRWRAVVSAVMKLRVP
jgi:hypothetical protein